MKWYNFETMFVSLSNGLRAFLKENNIYYELSGQPGFYHFEIKTDPAGVNMINNWLDENTIWNAGL